MPIENAEQARLVTPVSPYVELPLPVVQAVRRVLDAVENHLRLRPATRRIGGSKGRDIPDHDAIRHNARRWLPRLPDVWGVVASDGAALNDEEFWMVRGELIRRGFAFDTVMTEVGPVVSLLWGLTR
jgi:hypothetical protein